jgi:hypothetical protein
MCLSQPRGYCEMTMGTEGSFSLILKGYGAKLWRGGVCPKPGDWLLKEVGRGFGFWKVLYREDKLYWLAQINEQNGDPN